MGGVQVRGAVFVAVALASAGALYFASRPRPSPRYGWVDVEQGGRQIDRYMLDLVTGEEVDPATVNPALVDNSAGTWGAFPS